MMTSNKIIKKCFEDLYKNDFLDKEDDERRVRKELDKIEYSMSYSHDIDNNVSLQFLP